MSLLIFNAGSSTLKFSLIDSASQRVWAYGAADSGAQSRRYTWNGEADESISETAELSDLDAVIKRIVGDVKTFLRTTPAAGDLDAIVHRIVHGGSRFTQPVRITDQVRTEISGLEELAPLHNRPGLEVIDTALHALPDVPHIAVFDTTFHTTLAPEAFTYPLPAELSERWGLRRFGFHGLSHAYCAQRAEEMIAIPPDGLHLVIAHLGNGASVTATRGGRSVDTSMGFTPLEGLMMGTRSGSIDPGLLLHLQLQCGMSSDEVYHVLYHESGLLGVSGISSDMREVLAASDSGNARASLAVRIFAHRARQAIGASAVTLGRVDALIFTGGIGEHSPAIRSLVCEGLSCLGLEIDPAANRSAQPDAMVSSSASPGPILVLKAREDLMMARAAMAVLARAPLP